MSGNRTEVGHCALNIRASLHALSAHGGLFVCHLSVSGRQESVPGPDWPPATESALFHPL